MRLVLPHTLCFLFILQGILAKNMPEAEDTHSAKQRLPEAADSINCEICGRCFTQRWVLKSHLLRVHRVDKPFHCMKCGRYFVVINSFRSHICSDKLAMCKCHICGEYFADDSEGHVCADQRKPLTHQCHICAQRFDDSGNAFKSHVCVDQIKLKIYKCRICGEYFNDSALLEEHAVAHTETEEHDSEENNCHANEETMGADDCHSPEQQSSHPKSNLLPIDEVSEGNAQECQDSPAKNLNEISLECHESLDGEFIDRLESSVELPFKYVAVREERYAKCPVEGPKLRIYCHPSSPVMIKSVDDMDDNQSSGYKCEICGDNFPHADVLKDHMRNIHGKLYCHLDSRKTQKQRNKEKRNISKNRKHRNRANLTWVKKLAEDSSWKEDHLAGGKYDYTFEEKESNPIKVGWDQKYQCGVCFKIHSGSASLRDHLTEEHKIGKKPLECYICGYTTRRNCMLLRHIRIHEGIRPYKCDLCPSAFYDRCRLVRHKWTHSDSKPLHCDICGSGFTEKRRLKTHYYKHTGELPHKCDICGAGFTDKAYLREHKFKHREKMPFECKNCGKGFGRKSCLISHFKYKKECAVTSMELSEEILNNKLEDRGSLSEFKCRICKKKFDDKSDLTMHHITVHKSVSAIIHKSYTCRECGREFSQRGILNMHIAKHDKPRHCSKCLLVFSDEESLTEHNNTIHCFPCEEIKMAVAIRVKEEPIDEQNN